MASFYVQGVRFELTKVLDHGILSPAQFSVARAKPDFATPAYLKII